MAEQQSDDSASADYFAKRGLRRYAGVTFALVGQDHLVLTPEEAFAIEKARR